MALRVGIAGRRGGTFVAGLRSVPGVTVQTLCDIDAEQGEQYARAWGIPRFVTRFTDMLETVDAVVVATPMHLHAPQSIAALREGKHVLSEVTAAVSLEECWRLRDAASNAEKKGLVYALSENYCFLRSNVLVRNLVRQGRFGSLTYGEGEYLHDVRSLHHHADGSPTWRSYWQVGDTGATYPTHSLGPVMQWFQEADPLERVVSVIAKGCGVHTDPEHPHDDTTVVLAGLSSGKLVRIRVDMMSRRPHQMAFYSLQGTHGVYEASRIAGQLGHFWFADGDPDHGERQWVPESDFEDALPPEWKNLAPEARDAGHGGADWWAGRSFAQACLGESCPDVDWRNGLEWTAVGLCSTLSVRNGGVPVQVPDFRDIRQRPVVLDFPETTIDGVPLRH